MTATAESGSEGTESPDYGSDADHGLSILGGVGTTLLLETSISGYFCGAHGLYESTWFVVDIRTGKTQPIEMASIGAAIPEAIQKGAAEETLPEVEACDDEPAHLTVASVMREMTLGYASIELAGEPAITWIYDFPLPYVCSHDYAAHGMGITGTLEAAAPLGLGPTAPRLKLALLLATGRRAWPTMVKVEEDSAGGDGWYWFERFGDSKFADAAGAGPCTGCHSSGIDFFRSPFPLQSLRIERALR